MFFSGSLIFILCSIPLQKDATKFLSVVVDGHLDCFWVWAILNSAAVNILLDVSCCTYTWVFVSHEIAQLNYIQIFNFSG